MSDASVHCEVVSGIAFITLCHPPVNSFNLGLRRELFAALERVACTPSAEAIVLSGAGRGFCAGGDINEFGTPDVLAEPRLTLHLHPYIENLSKPVVVALHGFAMGGGLETAMVCHGRVACADTRIALPEVKLGVIPPSGTQRLPRLIGMDAAIDFILSAQTRYARDFDGTPLFDRIVGAADIAGLREAACGVAHEILARGKPYPLVRNRNVASVAPGAALAVARERLVQSDAGVVQQGALEAIAAAAQSPDFEAGLRAANAICERLLASEEVQRRGRT
jgi:3-hydroxyacyl-CoA dehydrogenase